MYEISTQSSFSAAHHLKEYNGPCENVHGHNWQVRACVTCSGLDGTGIGIDFRVLKKSLEDILKEFDHRDLNDIFTSAGDNPSSENIARYIYMKLKQRIDTPSSRTSRVEVCETPGNCAAYFE